MPGMLAHLLAPVLEPAARTLSLQRTLAGPGAALTFDDGPHPEGTPGVLELLERAQAPAAFFVIGEQVRAHPAIARRIADAGHLVALHGDQHLLQARRSPRALRADLAAGIATIEDVVGVRPQWHRPPFGIYSPAGLAAVRDAGLRPLLWSRWGKDWRKWTTPERIAARVTRGLGQADVVLLHDADYYSARGSHLRTLAALPLILAELSRRKLDTVLPV